MLFNAEMIHLAGGTFRMGSDNHYPEERPAHEVMVDAFLIDAAPVTNRQFEKFVHSTGYVTLAETPPDPTQYPGMPAEMIYAGSLVFTPPNEPVDLRFWGEWWRFSKGANWRQPAGAGTNLEGLEDHPVVHIAYQDAAAFSVWADKELPTEAEWEYAARGGAGETEFAWGSEFAPGGKQMANTWQGNFPIENTLLDGYARTSPVGSYPPNGFGLYDMIGNVWEWTSDWYSQQHDVPEGKACCVPKNPRGPAEKASYDPANPDIRIPRRVLKGGSHLCAPNYCQRYRPPARHAQTIDTSTSHIGFRCIRRV